MLVCRSYSINDVGASNRRFRTYPRWRSFFYIPTGYVLTPHHQKPAGYFDERREGVRTYFMADIG